MEVLTGHLKNELDPAHRSLENTKAGVSGAALAQGHLRRVLPSDL